jgi:hypothetical protein
MTTATLLLAALIVPGAVPDLHGEITGRVVDGAAAHRPLAGFQVVLCVEVEGQPVPVETTISAADGRFRFAELPVGDDFVYLPGANRNAVHYPGPRLRLDAQNPRAQVELIAYDTVAAPCPLMVREHRVQVRTANGCLQVSESLVVVNPGNRTYIGESLGGMPPATLRLSIPDDFEKVTFQKEFFGRQFMVLDGRLLTSLPWPPGERTLEFTYLLPVEQSHRLLRRRLDLPTSLLTVTIDDQTRCHACNLPPQTSQPPGEKSFVSRGQTLAAGYVLELELGELPVPIMAYAKWVALLVLGGLIAASIRLIPKRSLAASGVISVSKGFLVS